MSLSQQRLALAAYAELFFLLAQNLIILFLIAYYAERPEGVTACAGASPRTSLAIVAYASSSRARSPPESRSARTSRLLITAPPPCSSWGRAPQILANHRARSTGELSFRHAGAHVRRVSGAHIHDGAGGGSASVVGAYAASAAMNWIILAQMVAYKGAAGGEEDEKEKDAVKGGGGE